MGDGRDLTCVRPIRWCGDSLELLDQRALPGEERYIRCRDVDQVAAAIRDMVVRGAPAIGVAAAYGMLLAGRTGMPLEQARERLVQTRPTAVNLAWAVDRLMAVGEPADETLVERLGREAAAIEAEDVAACAALAAAGLELFPTDARVLTHCNTGALATAGIGTALGLVRLAHATGRLGRLYADETRPFLQGARLTAWECAKDQIPCTLLADVAAGALLASGQVDLVVVGTDRTAANGDVANKIGTYPLAVLAHRHGVPFYVAAPTSSVDLSIADGSQIEIEQRPKNEVTHAAGVRIAPAQTDAWNPAFDITPAELVRAIVTEVGVARPPYTASLAACVAEGQAGTPRAAGP